MEWAQLFLDYLRVLIWPTLLLVVGLIFRPELKNLIDGVSEITGPGNLSLKRRINNVKLAAEDANEDTRDALESPAAMEPGDAAAKRHASDLDRYADMAEGDPVGAISGAWRLVRKEVRDTTRRLGTDRALPQGALTSLHVRSLVPLGLSEGMVGVARELSNLRNDVVKGRRLLTDGSTALAYLSATQDLLEAVAEVSDSHRRPGESGDGA